MRANLQPELVDELAREHNFDAGRLREALVCAVEAYDEEQAFWGWRGQASDQIEPIERVLVTVRRALRGWDELPAEARREVAYFVDPSHDADPVGPKLLFVSELLEEYGEYYGRSRGNPGHSRIGAERDLRPLERFAAVLIEFWLAEKRTPFGHVVGRYEEAAGFDPNKGERAPRVAESEAMEFLIAASDCLSQRYDVSNFETVVRRTKRNQA